SRSQESASMTRSSADKPLLAEEPRYLWRDVWAPLLLLAAGLGGVLLWGLLNRGPGGVAWVALGLVGVTAIHAGSGMAGRVVVSAWRQISFGAVGLLALKLAALFAFGLVPILFLPGVLLLKYLGWALTTFVLLVWMFRLRGWDVVYTMVALVVVHVVVLYLGV